MLLQPANQIIKVAVRLGLEFQGMVCLGILKDLFVRRGKALHEPARRLIGNDAILSRQLQEHRHPHMGRHPAQVEVQTPAVAEESGCCLAQGEGIVAQELLPAG